MSRNQFRQQVRTFSALLYIGIIESRNRSQCREMLSPPLHPRVRRRCPGAMGEQKEWFRHGALSQWCFASAQTHRGSSTPRKRAKDQSVGRSLLSIYRDLVRPPPFTISVSTRRRTRPPTGRCVWRRTVWPHFRRSILVEVKRMSPTGVMCVAVAAMMRLVHFRFRGPDMRPFISIQVDGAHLQISI